MVGLDAVIVGLLFMGNAAERGERADVDDAADGDGIPPDYHLDGSLPESACVRRSDT